MDFSKLKPGDWVLGISGIVLFIASFLPWYGVTESEFGVSYSYTESGWDVGFFWAGIPAILGLALVGLVVIQRFTDVELPEVGSLDWGQISLIGAAVAAVLVILKLLIGHKIFGFSLDRQWGIFVATAAALGGLVGGFLRMQEEKKAGAGGTPPPPPPAA